MKIMFSYFIVQSTYIYGPHNALRLIVHLETF